MSILDTVCALVKPISDLIDNLHTSDEERLIIKREVKELENKFLAKTLDYETKLMEHQASTIQAEAAGQSWIQRNWRPITMLTFLALVVLDSFGLLAFRLADDAWLLLQIGLGGYVAGRSAEKVVGSIKK